MNDKSWVKEFLARNCTGSDDHDFENCNKCAGMAEELIDRFKFVRNDALNDAALAIESQKVVHGDQYGTWSASCEYTTEHAKEIRNLYE